MISFTLVSIVESMGTRVTFTRCLTRCNHTAELASLEIYRRESGRDRNILNGHRQDGNVAVVIGGIGNLAAR